MSEEQSIGRSCHRNIQKLRFAIDIVFNVGERFEERDKDDRKLKSLAAMECQQLDAVFRRPELAAVRALAEKVERNLRLGKVGGNALTVAVHSKKHCHVFPRSAAGTEFTGLLDDEIELRCRVRQGRKLRQ